MSSILVVEVEGAISRVLNDELGSEEYQTVKVLNGDDAVQFALREIPRLIIFDLTLPYLNGHELIRQVREHPKCMHIPIIASAPIALWPIKCACWKPVPTITW